MKTVRNEKVAYEAPAVEAVELVIEGCILQASNGVGGSGSSDGADSEEM